MNRTRNGNLFSFFIVLIPFLYACSGAPADSDNLSPPRIMEPLFIVAIVPERNVFEQKKRYKPLARYLSEKLGLNVKIKLLDSYGAIYDEIQNTSIDGAFFGSFNYVLVKTRADIEPVARAVEGAGGADYKGIIFTRKDTGVTGDVESWRRKKIALVHKATTAGYVFPVWHLRKQGITDFNQYFSKLIFAGSHDAVILSVFKGQADIGAAKDSILQKLLLENKAMRDEIIILASSISVPSNSLCLRKGIDRNIKQSLSHALLSMHNAPDGKMALQELNASKFIATLDSEFNALRQMAEDIGVDPRSYPLRDRRR